MGRSGVVSLSVLVIVVLVGGCGTSERGEAEAADDASGAGSAPISPTKRLPMGKPCDLISNNEIVKIFGKKLSKQFPPEADGRDCSYSFDNAGNGVTVYRGLPGSAPARGESTTIGRFSGTKQQYGEICMLFLPLGSQGGAQVLGAAATLNPPDPMRSCSVAEKIVLSIYERLPE